MNINELNGFTVPGLGDSVTGYDIGDPGGSQSGWIVQSIGPGLDLYVFPDGTEVVADTEGNILG